MLRQVMVGLMVTGLMTVHLNGCATTDNDRRQAADHPSDQPGSTQLTPRLENRKFPLPGITPNYEKKYVDLDARVALTEGILELAACSGSKKNHESVVDVQALPSHIHYALILMGLKAGHPGLFEQQADGKLVEKPATGDPVWVYLVVNGKEIPINQFIRHRDSDMVLPGNQFIFAGSKFQRMQTGKVVYDADESGNLMSLVTFGDETLAWPEPASHQNQALIWQSNPAQLPKSQTPVIVRLRTEKP